MVSQTVVRTMVRYDSFMQRGPGLGIMVVKMRSRHDIILFVSTAVTFPI